MTTVSVVTIDSMLQLIAVLEETETGYFLTRPLRVFRNFSPSDKGTIESFALVSWVPFSEDEIFYIEKNKIMNIANLGEKYLFDYFNIAEATYAEEESNEHNSEVDEPTNDDIWDYYEAKKNNQIN